MILGMLLGSVKIPVIPEVLMILSGVVLIAGFAFLIYKHKATKGMDAVDTAKLDKVTHLAGKVFIVYMALELIAIAACVTANNACRGGYHYPPGTPCIFCNGSGAGTHSGASDILTLGIYFDAFIVNSFVVAAIKTVTDFIDSKKKKNR